MTTTAEPPALAKFTAAKRGMALVHHRHVRDYVIGQGASERDEYVVGIVTSVTREGIVKRYREAGWNSEHDGPAGKHFRGNIWLAPDLDADAAMAIAAAHTYPGHTQVMPFASLQEVREALRPCRV